MHRSRDTAHAQQFKKAFNGDKAYIAQPKQQKSKRCYYSGAR